MAAPCWLNSPQADGIDRFGGEFNGLHWGKHFWWPNFGQGSLRWDDSSSGVEKWQWSCSDWRSSVDIGTVGIRVRYSYISVAFSLSNWGFVTASSSSNSDIHHRESDIEPKFELDGSDADENRDRRAKREQLFDFLSKKSVKCAESCFINLSDSVVNEQE